jgi:hypothetical protein
LRLRHLLALTLLLSLTATPALAADPDAPPGAPASWLPNEAWVLEHWMPYRESDLQHLTGITRDDVRHHVAGGKYSLGELVRQRGWDPKVLVKRLVAPWRGHASARQRRELLRRAGKTMTQPHLMEHMFGHPFHEPWMESALPAILGVASRKDLTKLRGTGMTRLQIGMAHGRTADQILTAVRKKLREAADEGVREKAEFPDQAKAWLSYQESRLQGWLTGKPNWGMSMGGS